MDNHNSFFQAPRNALKIIHDPNPTSQNKQPNPTTSLIDIFHTPLFFLTIYLLNKVNKGYAVSEI